MWTITQCLGLENWFIVGTGNLCELNTAGLLELSFPDRCGRGVGLFCSMQFSPLPHSAPPTLLRSGGSQGGNGGLIRRPEVLKHIRAPQGPNLIGGHQKFSSVLSQESATL